MVESKGQQGQRRAVARKAAKSKALKPMDAAHDLWVGLDVSMKVCESWVVYLHKGVGPKVVMLPGESWARASKFK